MDVRRWASEAAVGIFLLSAGAATAQVGVPATPCDMLAASPNDPSRTAPAVAYENLDPALAIPACEKAVARHPNSARLLSQLGRSYSKGGKVVASVSPLQKAAAMGHPIAQYNLGVAYERGLGVPINFVEAVRLYRKSAEQGYSLAQSNLAGMYIGGRGVAQDYKEAIKLARMAAAQGNGNAQNMIGSMYVLGQGVAENIDEAEKWYRSAEAIGNELAKQNLAALMAAREKIATPKPNPAPDSLEEAVLQTRACIRANIPDAYRSGAYGDEQTNRFFMEKCYHPYAVAMQETGKGDLSYTSLAYSSFKLFVIQETRPDEWNQFQEKLRSAVGR